jgi:hypothetical protein
VVGRFIHKTMTETLIGGFFSKEDKHKLAKDIVSISGKTKLLDDLDELKRGLELSPATAEGKILEWFVADHCMWLKSQLRTALYDNRGKMISSNIRGLSFHCPLPVYLRTFYNVGKLKFGVKQISNVEGHSSLVIHHIIQHECDFFNLGFSKGWSAIREKRSVVRFFLCFEKDYIEKYPASKYEGGVCLRPKLFKMTYCVQTSTMTLKADILSF